MSSAKDDTSKPPQAQPLTTTQRVSPSPFTKVVSNAIASTIGASIVAVVVTPLDVVKVRLQAHVCPVGGASPCDDPHHVNGTLDAARKIIRSDGIRGLWRGLPVTLLLAIPTTGMYFTLYESLRDRLEETNTNLSRSSSALLSGALARTFSATISSPLELARTGLQAGVGGPSATVGTVLRHVVNTQGPIALWRGLGPTLLRDAPFSAIYWSSYESLKDPHRSILPRRFFVNGNDSAVYLCAGIGAGSLAALCTLPADVIKTRRQALVVSSSSGKTDGRVTGSSPFVILKNILEKEGIRGLFKGAGPRVAKVAPACAIMMGSYEWIKRFLGV